MVLRVHPSVGAVDEAALRQAFLDELVGVGGLLDRYQAELLRRARAVTISRQPPIATQAGKTLLARQKFAPQDLDEVILGCAAPSVDEVNIGRVAALRMGCGQKVPGWTVMRNCASGMQALDSAIANMLSGRSSLVLAGGVDALSRAPLLLSDAMVMWLSNFYAAKTFGQKAAAIAKLKLSYLAPVVGIMKGLTDPIVGLLMGQTAENVACRFGIDRRQMDEYAARSHARVIRSQEIGWPDQPHDVLAAEIAPGPSASRYSTSW